MNVRNKKHALKLAHLHFDRKNNNKFLTYGPKPLNNDYVLKKSNSR